MKIGLRGLISAPFTPMNQDGSLNLSIIPEYITALLNMGVDSVYVLGTTSEGLSLTIEERKAVAKKWVECGKDRLDKVVVHVGSNVIATTIELAKHAEEIGVDAIAMLPPSYYPITVSHVYSCFKTVAAAVPKLPIMYYHLPAFSGVHINIEKLMEMSCDTIPNFSGVKYSDQDLVNFTTILTKYGDRFDMCYGTDQNAFFARSIGCEAFVGSTYNFSANLFRAMLDAVEEGRQEDARKLTERIISLMNLLGSKGYNLGLQKRLTSDILGLEMGPPRLPNLPSTAEDNVLINSLKEALKQ